MKMTRAPVKFSNCTRTKPVNTMPSLKLISSPIYIDTSQNYSTFSRFCIS